jgi:hypothetical protein
MTQPFRRPIQESSTPLKVQKDALAAPAAEWTREILLPSVSISHSIPLHTKFQDTSIEVAKPTVNGI